MGNQASMSGVKDLRDLIKVCEADPTHSFRDYDDLNIVHQCPTKLAEWPYCGTIQVVDEKTKGTESKLYTCPTKQFQTPICARTENTVFCALDADGRFGEVMHLHGHSENLAKFVGDELKKNSVGNHPVHFFVLEAHMLVTPPPECTGDDIKNEQIKGHSDEFGGELLALGQDLTAGAMTQLLDSSQLLGGAKEAEGEGEGAGAGAGEGGREPKFQDDDDDDEHETAMRRREATVDSSRILSEVVFGTRMWGSATRVFQVPKNLPEPEDNKKKKSLKKNSITTEKEEVSEVSIVQEEDHSFNWSFSAEGRVPVKVESPALLSTIVETLFIDETHPHSDCVLTKDVPGTILKKGDKLAKMGPAKEKNQLEWYENLVEHEREHSEDEAWQSVTLRFSRVAKWGTHPLWLTDWDKLDPHMSSTELLMWLKMAPKGGSDGGNRTFENLTSAAMIPMLQKFLAVSRHVPETWSCCLSTLPSTSLTVNDCLSCVRVNRRKQDWSDMLHYLQKAMSILKRHPDQRVHLENQRLLLTTFKMRVDAFVAERHHQGSEDGDSKSLVLQRFCLMTLEILEKSLLQFNSRELEEVEKHIRALTVDRPHNKKKLNPSEQGELEQYYEVELHLIQDKARLNCCLADYHRYLCKHCPNIASKRDSRSAAKAAYERSLAAIDATKRSHLTGHGVRMHAAQGHGGKAKEHGFYLGPKSTQIALEIVINYSMYFAEVERDYEAARGLCHKMQVEILETKVEEGKKLLQAWLVKVGQYIAHRKGAEIDHRNLPAPPPLLAEIEAAVKLRDSPTLSLVVDVPTSMSLQLLRNMQMFDRTLVLVRMRFKQNAIQQFVQNLAGISFDGMPLDSGSSATPYSARSARSVAVTEQTPRIGDSCILPCNFWGDTAEALKDPAKSMSQSMARISFFDQVNPFKKYPKTVHDVKAAQIRRMCQCVIMWLQHDSRFKKKGVNLVRHVEAVGDDPADIDTFELGFVVDITQLNPLELLDHLQTFFINSEAEHHCFISKQKVAAPRAIDVRMKTEIAYPEVAYLFLELDSNGMLLPESSDHTATQDAESLFEQVFQKAATFSQQHYTNEAVHLPKLSARTAQNFD